MKRVAPWVLIFASLTCVGCVPVAVEETGPVGPGYQAAPRRPLLPTWNPRCRCTWPGSHPAGDGVPAASARSGLHLDLGLLGLDG